MGSLLRAVFASAFLCIAAIALPAAAQDQQSQDVGLTSPEPGLAKKLGAPILPSTLEALPAEPVAPPALQAAPAVPTIAAPAVSTEAAPAEPEAAPVVQLPAGDLGLAQKLQELIGTRLADFIERKPEQAAVEAFYRERGFQPLWTSNGAATARATEVSGFLKNVASEGLNPSDYPTPDLAAKSTDADAATNELKLA